MNEGRLNLRIDAELVEWTKEYCARNGTTISSLVRMLLVSERMRDEENKNSQVDAEQI
jgi:antitoxin component of RelBE/YafQ-DinJ toxin-antitoxin module